MRIDLRLVWLPVRCGSVPKAHPEVTPYALTFAQTRSFAHLLTWTDTRHLPLLREAIGSP